VLTPSFLSLLVLAGLHWILSLHVLRSNRHVHATRAFAFFGVFAGFWTVSIALAHHVPLLTPYLVRLTFLLGAVLAYTFLRMAFLISSHARSWLRIRFIASPLLTCFASLSVTRYLVLTGHLTPRGLIAVYGPAHLPFALYISVCFSLGFLVLLTDYRAASGTSRAKLRCFILSLFLPALGAVTTNLLVPLLFKKSRVGFYGPMFALFFFAFTTHGFLRYRLFDVAIFIRRSVTTTAAVLTPLIPLSFLLYVYWPRLASTLQPVEFTVLVAGLLLIGLAAPYVRQIAERALDSYVHHTRREYTKTLKDASRQLTRVLDLSSLLRLIQVTVSDALGAASVTLFLRCRDDRFSASSNETLSAPGLSKPLILPPAIVEALVQRKEAFLLDHAASVQRERPLRPLSRLDDTLFIPINSDDHIIGVVAVGPKDSGSPFFSQDIDLLSTLANQVGVAIKNAQLYEQVVLINEHLQNIVSTIESGVIAIDRAGIITIFNRAAAQLTALRADAVLGRGLATLPDAFGEPLMATAEDGQPRVLAELELPRQSDPPLPVICLTSPLRGPGGGLLGAVAVLSDLTPLKQLETERRRAEQLAYFEVLAAGIGHEIKNPLVAVKTFTQLLPRKFLDEQFRQEFVRIVGREVRRMEHLAERLRSLARPGGGPHVPLELRAPIIDAVELVRPRLEEKRIATEWTLGGRSGQVLGDRAALEQLFLNLFVNALEAMEPGGTLSLRLQTADDRVTVEVEDTGPGMPEEFLSRIFDPFVTTKFHGSGLGLAICASIANAHHARICAANKPGQRGAIFTIDFPTAVLAPTAAKA
jgi:PAS domain S-box-containing protein